MLASVWPANRTCTIGVGVRKISIVLIGLLVGSLTVFSSTGLAQAENHLPPIAIASLEVTTPATDTTPAVVTLDGSDSFDPDVGGTIVRYRWEVITEAYSWLELNQANPQSPTATFEVPVQKLIERFGWSIEFRLTVTDSGRPAATDSDVVKLRINQPPVVDIEITANLYDRDDEPGIDDNRNGAVDENEERYTIEGVVSRPGERGNAPNEWHIRASSLLVIDASGSFDPDGELTDQSFSWERLHTRGATSVADSLPGDTEHQQFLSTDEDPNTPGTTSSETVARLPFVRGVGTEPFQVYYRLTVTDEGGAITRETVKIVIDDFHDHPEVEILRPEADSDATSSDDRYEGVLEAGEDRYVISPEVAEQGVALVAEGEADGTTRTNALRHIWSGEGVEPSEDNEPGSRSEAEFTAPAGTTEGESFTVAVEVVDPDGLRTKASIELVVADTVAPVAVAPEDIDTFDGIDGGFPVSDPPTGIVELRGVAFDPDGDELTYEWEQVRNAAGDPLRVTFRGSKLLLVGSTSLNASFKLPEVTRGNSETVYVQFTVADRWGATATDVVQITIRDGNDDLKAIPEPEQRVPPGTLVKLTGRFRSGLVSADAHADVAHQWVYRGIETDPPIVLRPSITSREQAQGFVPGEWFPNTDGTYHPTAGGRLKQADTPFAYFDAPELDDFNGVKLIFDLTVRYRADEDAATVAISVLKDSGLKYYSGPIDGLDYCTNRSLGGPTTYPFDSDGDGVADVCALQGTRREAVARQIALEQLADLNQDMFNDALLFGLPDDPDTEDVDESTAGTCSSAPADLGDTEEQLADDVCGRYAIDPDESPTVSPVPGPVDAVSARKFYSGVIDSPTFCPNHSLGGPTTYPFDHDGDAVADVCALPYTRREAVARHNALKAAFANHPQFPAALATACTSLGTLDFGDLPAALATDACHPPTDPPELGSPLPTPSV